MRVAERVDLRPGDRHKSSIVIDGGAIDDFASVSGDDNPLHMDSIAARRMGFGRRVAHGAILLSELSRVIGTEFPGPGSLWLSSDIEFQAPVYMGDDVELCLTIEHVSTALDIVLLSVEARSLRDEKVVLTGTAKIKVLKDFAPMTQIPIEDQHILVSGGTRGLGATVARLLVGRGARVIALYRSDEASAQSLLADVADDRLTVHRCDLADPRAIQDLFATLSPTEDPIHGFVHAASPPLRDVPLAELDWADVARFIDTCVRGGFELARACLPHFEAAGYGRAVMIGTEATQAPRAGWTHYVTAKTALTGLVRALAVELPRVGATANVVSPGLLHTSDVLEGTAKSLVRNATPLKRLATEEEVAEVVAFLLGQGGSFINGATLPVTGGRVLFS